MHHVTISASHGMSADSFDIPNQVHVTLLPCLQLP